MFWISYGRSGCFHLKCYSSRPVERTDEKGKYVFFYYYYFSWRRNCLSFCLLFLLKGEKEMAVVALWESENNSPPVVRIDSFLFRFPAPMHALHAVSFFFYFSSYITDDEYVLLFRTRLHPSTAGWLFHLAAAAAGPAVLWETSLTPPPTKKKYRKTTGPAGKCM